MTVFSARQGLWAKKQVPCCWPINEAEILGVTENTIILANPFNQNEYKTILVTLTQTIHDGENETFLILIISSYLKNKCLCRSGHSFSSTKNIRNLKIWSLCILKNSKNQNLNKCNIKRKMGVSMFQKSSCICRYFNIEYMNVSSMSSSVKIIYTSQQKY